jgi:hypothetical protein
LLFLQRLSPEGKPVAKGYQTMMKINVIARSGFRLSNTGLIAPGSNSQQSFC